jgi:acetyl-CoA C-acetyltransferase
MVEYFNLNCRYVDCTETGGSSYLSHVGHAAAAIAAGQCHVALVTMAGRPLSTEATPQPVGPEGAFENLWGMTLTAHNYALVANRYMHEYGATSRELAEVKVAASMHAQYNPNAILRNVVTVDEVIESPLISDPLHRLDCCVTTDGGGAIVVVSAEIARHLSRAGVKVLGQATAIKHSRNGRIDLTTTGAALSGPAAFAEAGIDVSDVDYVSIYDSFTITVLLTLEDLGFCEKGNGGRFVRDGGLLAPFGQLPFNTDGGGLCNNHPGRRGGMVRIIEAVRQLRDEAHPAVQVTDCQIAAVQGTGGRLGTRSGSATLILGREDA